ncbi:MAG: DUF1028 domain-containing protein, partial [Chloroflexota bacterium]
MEHHIHTFSIVAYDRDVGAWGVAVASRFLAAGAVVSWAQAGAGAVATQALANLSFGPDGLAQMATGASAVDTLAALLAADDMPDRRQVALVDAQGGVAAHTGSNCSGWAGHITGEGFACHGNLLTGEVVIQSMAAAYHSATGELADRLLSALQAGERVGGDRRGKQSAGLLVVRPNGGYGGRTDRYIDLRVDDDPTPLTKLADMLAQHHLLFGETHPDNLVLVTPELATELQTMLIEQDYMQGEADGRWDELTKQAFWQLVSHENLVGVAVEVPTFFQILV